jgi:hypothetical protein
MTPVLVKRAAIGLAMIVAIAGCGNSSGSSAQTGESDFPRSTSSRFVPTSTPGANPLLIPTHPTGPVLDGPPVSEEDGDAQFKLTIEADQDRYRAGQQLHVTSTLRYLGPNAGIVVSGSGTGLVLFAIRRDDPPLQTEPAGTSDCRRYEVPAGIAVERPFIKTGGWSEDEPNAAFYRAYFSSPDVRLPAGNWTVSAFANFNEGADCTGPVHNLTASVAVIVEP